MICECTEQEMDQIFDGWSFKNRLKYLSGEVEKEEDSGDLMRIIFIIVLLLFNFFQFIAFLDYKVPQFQQDPLPTTLWLILELPVPMAKLLSRRGGRR